MTFAHSTSGGGNLDQIALAVGLVLLGLAFLVQRSLDRRVSVILVALGLVAFLGSFTFLKGIGQRTITVQDQEFTEDQLVEGVIAICLTRDTFDNDLSEAQVHFLDRAHIALHAVAAAIEDDDRELSGRLLVAKQAVERGFAEKVEPQEMTERLEELLTVTIESLEVLEVPASRC